jgi:hypothetical protein
MTMQRLRITVGVALIGLASVALATPAGASGPAIAVTPNSDLADGQTVTVTASGFTIPTPTIIGIEECSTKATSPYVNDCDTSTATFFSVTTGNYSESYSVVRHITTPNEGFIDCAVPNACEILSGGAYPDTSQEATAPIGFTGPPADLNLENAKLVHRVKPGEPVEVKIKAANDGPTATNWTIVQTSNPGFVASSVACGKGDVESVNECTYAANQAKVGHTVRATFSLEVPVGYSGHATDTVCLVDTNATDVDPNPADNCVTLAATVP